MIEFEEVNRFKKVLKLAHAFEDSMVIFRASCIANNKVFNGITDIDEDVGNFNAVKLLGSDSWDVLAKQAGTEIPSDTTVKLIVLYFEDKMNRNVCANND